MQAFLKKYIFCLFCFTNYLFDCHFFAFLSYFPPTKNNPATMGRVAEKFYFSIAKYSDAVITGILDRVKS